ncbi:EexN family lipoprotein [Acidithiobacillus sp. IBUN Pt1247-S3]|uniref:EexN family lipoprotein n=1 Tax=Acidithiobacillus sp. IBUN Pt1247-S3 TaxID=3166642 RepID=UPI0034E4E44A
MKRASFFSMVCLAVVLSGCSNVEQGPEGTHNVKWYVAHAKQMRKELSWCGNQASRLALEACKNANAAYNYNALKAAMGGGPLTSKGPTPSQPLRARRAKRGRVVPRRQRGVLHPPKRPRKLGVQACAVPLGCRQAIWETSAPTAPQRGRDGAPVTRAAGAYYLVGSARPIAQGRAKRLAEHADSLLFNGQPE